MELPPSSLHLSTMNCVKCFLVNGEQKSNIINMSREHPTTTTTTITTALPLLNNRDEVLNTNKIWKTKINRYDDLSIYCMQTKMHLYGAEQCGEYSCNNHKKYIATNPTPMAKNGKKTLGAFNSNVNNITAQCKAMWWQANNVIALFFAKSGVEDMENNRKISDLIFDLHRQFSITGKYEILCNSREKGP